MSKGFDPNQPRDPAGSETGGEWTAAGNAARKAAGLDKQYMVKWAGRGGESLPVYVVPGGGVLSKEASENLEDSDYIPVFYNAETNSWHVASSRIISHGSFSKEAMEGVQKTFQEQFLARGYLKRGLDEGIRLYDHEYDVAVIIGSQYHRESALIAGLKRVRSRAESNPLSFYDTSGRLVTPVIGWVELGH